jgi:hypothetical protein
MATCNICGYEDETLPVDWSNWECDFCVKDEIDGITGANSPLEKRVVATGIRLGNREIR